MARNPPVVTHRGRKIHREQQWESNIRFPARLDSRIASLCEEELEVGANIGEYIAAERGLGYLQLQANSQFDTTLNFATVVTISLLGVLLNFVLALIEFKVFYRRESAK